MGRVSYDVRDSQVEKGVRLNFWDKKNKEKGLNDKLTPSIYSINFILTYCFMTQVL